MNKSCLMMTQVDFVRHTSAELLCLFCHVHGPLASEIERARQRAAKFRNSGFPMCVLSLRVLLI